MNTITIPVATFDAMWEALETLQWSEYCDPDGGSIEYCTECRADKKYGHSDGCKISAMLAAAPQK
jgi:hypothetical protein